MIERGENFTGTFNPVDATADVSWRLKTLLASITKMSTATSDLDKPRSEVAVDIFVIEASKVFSRQLTSAVASTGLNVPVKFSPRSIIQVNTGSSSSSSSSSSATSGTSSSTSVGLNSLGHLASSDFAITQIGR